MTKWVEKYVGIPFVDGGREWSGLDCWGLVRLVLKTECNIEVPSYGEISATELSRVAHEVAQEIKGEPWHAVSEPNLFDVAVMHRHVAPVHVGIIVAMNPVRMLHIEKLTSSVFIPVTHYSVKFRHIVYFRHQRLMADAV